MAGVITSAHKEKLLRMAFLGTGIPSNWYVGLIAVDNFTGDAVSDTMGSHPGWEEFTDYESATRPQVTSFDQNFGTSNPGGQPGNAFRYGFFNTVFEISLSGPGVTPGGVGPFLLTRPVSRIWGFFVTDSATKGGTTGHLMLTAPLALGTAAVGSPVNVPQQAPLLIGDELHPEIGVQTRTSLIEISSTP